MTRSIVLSAVAVVAILLPASGPARSLETITMVHERIQRVSPVRQGPRMRTAPTQTGKHVNKVEALVFKQKVVESSSSTRNVVRTMPLWGTPRLGRR